MAVTAVFLKGIRVVLEYGMLLWLLWFTVALSRRLFGAVRKQSAAIRRPETKPPEAVGSVLEAPEPELAGKRFAFGDLGCSNQTYVNGQLLEGRAYLRPGDKIRIGLVTLRFER